MEGTGLAEEVALVRDSVRAGGLLAPPRPVLVMLSGGRDSVCLLDVAVALRTAQAVSALHVNYGLRAQADADEGQPQVCGPLHVVAGQHPEPARVLRQVFGDAELGRKVRRQLHRVTVKERGTRNETGHQSSCCDQ